MLLIKGTEAQRVILSVSHSHLNNFCNKWGTDGISETLQPENRTISHRCFRVVMMVCSVKCVTYTREEGLGLAFHCGILITVFGHHSPLYSISPFTFYPWLCISQDTDAEQLREGW